MTDPVARSYLLRATKFPIEDVLHLITPKTSKIKIKFGDRFVDMGSLRYHVFKRSLVCVTCGIVGQYFALEQHRDVAARGSKTWHFNLYAVKDGEEVLMTKDHIQPKSAGGSDKMANLQTMCSPCNLAKGNLCFGETP